jgi:hypothetical protein
MTELQTIDPNALAQALVMLAAQGQRTKAVSATPRSGGYAHGAYGLMSAPGMSRDVINAMMLPHLGLMKLLSSHPTVEDYAFYGILTGQTVAPSTAQTALESAAIRRPPGCSSSAHRATAWGGRA